MWCRVLEKFLKQQEAVFAKDYVILSISDEQLANVEPVVQRLRRNADGGIPWMVILDSNGDSLVTSDGPNGNVGYPFEPDEIDYFIDMLKRAGRRISGEELSQLKEELEAFAEKTRKARRAAPYIRRSTRPGASRRAESVMW